MILKVNNLSKIIFKPITNDYNSYYYTIKSLLNDVKENRLLIVKFNYEVIKDLDKYYDTVKHKDIYKARKVCLKLIEKTVNKPASLTNRQHKAKLQKAANAAYAAANAAGDAAGANAAYAANAAASAAAGDAVVYAAGAAANAAANAAEKYNETARLQSIKQSYYILVEMLMEEYNLGNVKTFKLLYKGL